MQHLMEQASYEGLGQNNNKQEEWIKMAKYTENHIYIMNCLDELKDDIREVRQDLKSLSGIKMRIAGLGIVVSFVVSSAVIFISKFIFI